ncbi:hypothetical protein ACOZB2_02740, partial [Pantoea endophytica]
EWSQPLAIVSLNADLILRDGSQPAIFPLLDSALSACPQSKLIAPEEASIVINADVTRRFL